MGWLAGQGLSGNCCCQSGQFHSPAQACHRKEALRGQIQKEQLHRGALSSLLLAAHPLLVHQVCAGLLQRAGHL